jgi:hypothetical protein
MPATVEDVPQRRDVGEAGAWVRNSYDTDMMIDESAGMWSIPGT